MPRLYLAAPLSDHLIPIRMKIIGWMPQPPLELSLSAMPLVTTIRLPDRAYQLRREMSAWSATFWFQPRIGIKLILRRTLTSGEKDSVHAELRVPYRPS